MAANTPDLSPNELADFGRALIELGNSSSFIKAKFFEMCKEATKSADFKEMHRALGPNGKKLAGAIFGKSEDGKPGGRGETVKEAVYPRPSPPIFSRQIGTLPLEMIFKNVDPIDVLNFAIISKKSQALVKRLSINVEKIKIENEIWPNGRPWRHLCGRTPDPQFTIKFEMLDKRVVTIRVNCSREAVIESRRNGTIRKICFFRKNDCEFAMLPKKNAEDPVDCYLACLTEAAAETVAKKVFKFFYKIYRTPNTSIDILAKKQFFMYFVQNICKRFDNVKIRLEDVPTQREMRILMENITVLGKFEQEAIRFQVPHYEFKRPFQHKKLELCMYLNIQNLINMQCEVLNVVRSTPLPVDDFKTFVQHWIDGGVPQLERLDVIVDELYKSNATYDEFREHVMKSLRPVEVNKWNPPLQDLKIHGEKQIELEKVLYIRGDDGRMAFLQQNYGTFSFFVWHDRFLEQNAQ